MRGGVGFRGLDDSRYGMTPACAGRTTAADYQCVNTRKTATTYPKVDSDWPYMSGGNFDVLLDNNFLGGVSAGILMSRQAPKIKVTKIGQ